MAYTIYWTETFQKIYFRLDSSEKDWILSLEKQLEVYPHGKILRYSWFREKKYSDKRLYFLVEEKQKKILFVDFSSKKDQVKSIQKILMEMESLLDYLRYL